MEYIMEYVLNCSTLQVLLYHTISTHGAVLGNTRHAFA